MTVTLDTGITFARFARVWFEEAQHFLHEGDVLLGGECAANGLRTLGYALHALREFS